MATTEHIQADPWLEASKKYHIHIETINYTSRCQDIEASADTALTLQGMRTQMVTFSREVNGHYDFQGSEREFVIPTLRADNGVPVTVYTPESVRAAPAVLVYFHGGSLLMGSRETHENCLKYISEQSGAIIVNVEYRLLPCPEDPLAPFHDAVDVTDWVMKNKEAIGGCSDSSVGVGGDSAGGQVACSVSEDIHGLAFQILIYPTVTDLSSHFESLDEFSDIPIFNTKFLAWRLSITNAPVPDASSNTRLNALARTDFDSSPRSLIIIAQLDPLRDCIYFYGQKLKDAGVEVREELIEAVPHGFFSFPGIFKTKAKEAFAHIIDFMKTFQQ